MTTEIDQCFHCGQVIVVDADGRWGHVYDVRGHGGPWRYCPVPRTTRATPAGIAFPPDQP